MTSGNACHGPFCVVRLYPAESGQVRVSVPHLCPGFAKTPPRARRSHAPRRCAAEAPRLRRRELPTAPSRHRLVAAEAVSSSELIKAAAPPGGAWIEKNMVLLCARQDREEAWPQSGRSYGTDQGMTSSCLPRMGGLRQSWGCGSAVWLVASPCSCSRVVARA